MYLHSVESTYILLKGLQMYLHSGESKYISLKGL